jgi:hypothetical protein
MKEQVDAHQRVDHESLGSRVHGAPGRLLLVDAGEVRRGASVVRARGATQDIFCPISEQNLPLPPALDHASTMHDRFHRRRAHHPTRSPHWLDVSPCTLRSTLPPTGSVVYGLVRFQGSSEALVQKRCVGDSWIVEISQPILWSPWPRRLCGLNARSQQADRFEPVVRTLLSICFRTRERHENVCAARVPRESDT